MEKERLTPIQAEILQYLKEHIAQKGFPPSVREIGDYVHLKSTSSVHAHMQTLERKGYIRRDPNHPRAIDILDDEWKKRVEGQIAAPVLRNGIFPDMKFWKESDVESYIPLPGWLAEHAGIPVVLHAEDHNGKGLVLIDVGRTPKEGLPAAMQTDDRWIIQPYRKESRIPCAGPAVCFLSMYEKEDAVSTTPTLKGSGLAKGPVAK